MLVDIPKDVTQAKTEWSYPKTVSLRSYNPVTKGHSGQIKKAVQLLARGEEADGLRRRRRRSSTTPRRS